MKKIIKGKRYDTETAERLGSYTHGGRRDFSHYSEDLYRKRTGEFFIYGEGGPASKYAEQLGLREWTDGEALIPLSYEEAQTWVEEHLEVDDYVSIFGDPGEEGTARKTVTYSLPADAVEAVRKEAARSGRTQSDIIQSLIYKAYGKTE